MHNGRRSVAVIGGGASGLAAAIAAARAGAQVDLYESGKAVGAKILKTGNGRCNFTHEDIQPGAYNRPEFVTPLLEGFGTREALAFFSSLGLMARFDGEGRAYPISNAASSVCDVFRLECSHLGVREHVGCEVSGIQKSDAGFSLYTGSAGQAGADAVVVATGGGTKLLALMRHPFVKGRPTLCAIRCASGPIKGLSGQRVRCKALLLRDGTCVDIEEGEMQFRDFGISGIMAFDLSRYALIGDEVSMDFFPGYGQGELESLLAARAHDLSWREGATFLTGMLARLLAEAVLHRAESEQGKPKDAFRHLAASELPIGLVAALLKDFRLRIEGFDRATAQVTSGGADTAYFDPETMESTIAPGLFACGETLDIDGRCGGYNLHWAWASGLAAGAHAAGGKAVHAGVAGGE